MILDARWVNAIALAPPGVHLCSVEGLSKIEIELPSDLPPEIDSLILDQILVHVGISDVKDCFHRLILTDELSDLFCLDESFTAADFDYTGQVFDGHVLAADAQVWCASRSLPMGFSWSLFFAQDVNLFQLQKVPAAQSATVLSDVSLPALFTPEVPDPETTTTTAPVSSDSFVSRNVEKNQIFLYVYVDNIGILSLRREFVGRRDACQLYRQFF